MTVTFVVPCFNAERNLQQLYASLECQTDRDWRAVLIDDISDDETAKVMQELASLDSRVEFRVNSEKKFALRNVVETSLALPDEMIVANLDGDDELCNASTVALLHQAYASDIDIAWTRQRWDINEKICVSAEMPQNVNAYCYPWVSSHLKTWRSSLLKRVPIANFLDHRGEWFQRGYDAALYLPMLELARGKRRFISDVCYLYKINSCSINDRKWAETKQLQTVNFVRARGFVER